MSTRAALIGGGAALVAMLCGGTIVAPLAGMYTGASAVGQPQPSLAACGQPDPAAAAAPAGGIPGLDAEQTTDAVAIVTIGRQMQIPPRGWVIAVATALQEASLHNPGNLGARNDRDSLGVFQQRPSQGWGTPAQVMDPAYSSRKFYEHLTAVPGWQGLPLTVAAQRVQRSAFPDAYAKHEARAAAIVDAVTGGAANAGPTPGVCAAPGQVTAGGWTQPVKAAIVSGFRPPSRPTHNGVDLAVPKHTAIHAAADGVVIRSICDPATAAARGCDVDGSSATPGCGWYVDIRHAGGIITRYCHQIVRPLVSVGDTVTAGQQIGWSGTSGNSSGPHLHFEVHHNNDEAGSTGAIDPVPFMRDHGAPLGG